MLRFMGFGSVRSCFNKPESTQASPSGSLLKRFPDVRALATAAEDDVMKAWEGLGYYRRARLLHKAAKAIASRGAFPTTHRQWLDVPGVGPYTAAAIASIALNEPVAAVDGNVNRVISRGHPSSYLSTTVLDGKRSNNLQTCS